MASIVMVEEGAKQENGLNYTASTAFVCWMAHSSAQKIDLMFSSETSVNFDRAIQRYIYIPEN
jgi:hypothetical protein